MDLGGVVQGAANFIGGLFGGGGSVGSGGASTSQAPNYSVGGGNAVYVPPGGQAPNTSSVPGGGAAVYTPPPVQATKQTSSGNTSGGGGGGGFPSNPNVNQFYNGYRWTGTNWAAPAQGVSQDELNQINNLFSGSENYLNNLLTNVLPQSQQQNLGSATDYYNTQLGLLPGEQQQLMSPIEQNKQQFQGAQESAAAAAQRAYQGLQQQSQAGYGAGSSTGGALNDLAAQQFAINQGQLQQQSGAGQLEFANEGNQVGQFIAQKKADLGNWFNEAKLQINQNFQAQIAQVNQQLGLTEDAKTQAKLGILQNVQQQNNAIETANAEFGQKLALFEATQSQNGANASAGQANTALGNQVAYGQLSNMFQPLQPLGVTNLTSGQSGGIGIAGSTGRNTQDIFSQNLGSIAGSNFSLPGFGAQA